MTEISLVRSIDRSLAGIVRFLVAVESGSEDQYQRRYTGR